MVDTAARTSEANHNKQYNTRPETKPIHSETPLPESEPIRIALDILIRLEVIFSTALLDKLYKHRELTKPRVIICL